MLNSVMFIDPRPPQYYSQSSQAPCPYYFLKYIFRFVLKFNLASQHMLIKTMLITLSRVISKDFSNIILRSIVRFNFILNVHSFVIIVIIYVIMWVVVC